MPRGTRIRRRPLTRTRRSSRWSYLRTHRPPLLAVWGKNDPFILPHGAEAYRRDQPAAEIHFFDTGHFALETHATEIAAAIREFLNRTSLAHRAA